MENNKLPMVQGEFPILDETSVKKIPLKTPRGKEVFYARIVGILDRVLYADIDTKEGGVKRVGGIMRWPVILGLDPANDRLRAQQVFDWIVQQEMEQWQ